MRRVRRGLLTLLVIVLAATLLSVGYNAFTTPPRTLPALAGEDLNVAGTRLHYQHWGDYGRPVVLIHGFFESSVAWAPAAEVLAREHQVYAIDMAGYGYTDYNGHYTLSDQVELVDGFIHALNLQSPIVVGHSLGAAVAGGIALTHPNDVGGMVFVDGDALPFAKSDSSGNSDSSSRRGPGWVTRVPFVISAYRAITGSTRLSEMALRRSCGSACRGLTPALARDWMRPARQGVAEDALRVIARGGLLHLDPQELQSITVPRAIIWGAEDAHSGGSLSDAQRYLHDPPTAVIAGAGHLAMIADPEGVAGALESQISQMPGR